MIMGASVRPKDGKWYVFIRSKGGRAAQKYDTQEAAEKVAVAVRDAIKAGVFDISAMQQKRANKAKEQPAVATSPTLTEFFDKTMTPLWEATLAPNTYARYETSFRIHIKPAIGDLPLNQVTRDRIKAFVVSLVQKNAEKRTYSVESQAKEAERKLSKDSIRNIVAALRGALTEAVEKGILAANPASKLGKLYREAGAVRDEVDPFTAEEIPLLLEATLKHFGHANYVLLLAALHTGMRAGELAGLQWDDIDFRSRFITVRRQYQDGKNTKTKTRKAREVVVSDVLLKELQALRKARREDYLGRGKNEIPEPVFLSPGLRLEEGKREEGQPVDMDHFRNRVYWKACEKAQLRRRRLHDTRHTFASILLMNGESPAYVKEQLGHSSIKITVDVYGHFIPGANRQAVNKLPSISTPQAATKAASGN